MLLVADIGNTNIVFGLFEGKELRATWRVATDAHKTSDEYAVLLTSLLRCRSFSASDIREAAISSVVPPLDGVFEDLCRSYFDIRPLFVEPGVRTGVRIRTDNPREVGADRIANAVAAFQRYGGPLIVLDFGTATTLDAISDVGDYLGGAIAPGIGIAAEALFARASKLPRIDLVPPKRAIGTNTVACMQSGIIFGYVGLVEGMVHRIREELGSAARVIATGGLANVIAQETKIIDVVDEDLTLYGVYLIHEANKVPVPRERGAGHASTESESP